VIKNNATPFTHTFATAGTYQVKLFVTTSDGCNSLVKQRAVVIAPQPKPDFSFTDTSCLPNAIISFKNLSTIANGTESSFMYSWNFGDPAGGLSNTSTALNPTYHYLAVGPYNVKLQVTSGAHCIHDTTIVLNTIHPQPKADFDFNKPSVCIGSDVIFRDRSNGKDAVVTAWNWAFGDHETSWLQNPSHTYSTIGLYQVTFYSINSFGCNSDTVTKPYNVYPYPEVNAGPDQFVLEGETIILPAVASGNNLQYLWAPNLYLNNNKILAPSCSPTEDITYTLRVTAKGDCIKSDNVFIKVLKTPKIPNTFTPNNDGKNDTWDIQYLENNPDCRVQVFTRTGQLVFESKGYKPRGWDGTLKGKPLPVDTYYYIIEPESGRKPITGYVTIIK
jgi:gliding motility-associated-like protein